ncbi:MAG: Hpt domain-containing protein [Sulfurimonas sp.]|jgi:HPt (histidine-containing phosphotransfer) domain-containing protein|nr:Hpt domain-containing protein [Sulfurimonas sp.]
MPIQNADYSNINLDEMAVAIGLKAKHMPMLIGSFLDESVSIMQSLSDAIGSNDFANIKIYAHSIKGSAGNLKFTEIYEMTKEMEFSASNSDASFDYKAYLEAVKLAIATIPN